jgi:hypothetical protein
MIKIGEFGHSFKYKYLTPIFLLGFIVIFSACTQNENLSRFEYSDNSLRSTDDYDESYNNSVKGTEIQKLAETSGSGIRFNDGVLKIGTAIRIAYEMADYACLEMELPKIISDSDVAVSINEKILEEFSQNMTLDDVKKNYSNRDYPYLQIGYEIIHINDIYVIAVKESVSSKPASGISNRYWRYYYNPTEDAELTEDAFLERIGLSREEVIREYKLNLGIIMRGMTMEEAETALQSGTDDEISYPVNYSDIEHLFTIDKNKVLLFEFDQ